MTVLLAHIFALEAVSEITAMAMSYNRFRSS